MVFCNKLTVAEKKELKNSHNPYFNRWFSAIIVTRTLSNACKLSQSLF